jgi:hypothetical protein
VPKVLVAKVRFGYLLPNVEVQINFHNERPIGLQLLQIKVNIDTCEYMERA